uniref:Uncharacterized protein n=1 Tax=Oryza sativa subsp. japonica TaxID=39947 RepID=Q654U7_ORYSJ|nr:hypothetical protein [Oryza sativa Japonica Group]
MAVGAAAATGAISLSLSHAHALGQSTAEEEAHALDGRRQRWSSPERPTVDAELARATGRLVAEEPDRASAPASGLSSAPASHGLGARRPQPPPPPPPPGARAELVDVPLLACVGPARGLPVEDLPAEAPLVGVGVGLHLRRLVSGWVIITRSSSLSHTHTLFSRWWRRRGRAAQRQERAAASSSSPAAAEGGGKPRLVGDGRRGSRAS